MSAPLNAKRELASQFVEVAKGLEYLKKAPLEEGTIQAVLYLGAQPLKDSLQREYLKADPTQYGGELKADVIVKVAKKRKDRVYVGPDPSGRNLQIWTWLQYGTLMRETKGRRIARRGANKGKMIGSTRHSTGIMPASRFMDKAVSSAKTEILRVIGKQYAIAMMKHAKKAGLK